MNAFMHSRSLLAAPVVAVEELLYFHTKWPVRATMLVGVSASFLKRFEMTLDNRS